MQTFNKVIKNWIQLSRNVVNPHHWKSLNQDCLKRLVGQTLESLGNSLCFILWKRLDYGIIIIPYDSNKCTTSIIVFLAKKRRVKE